MTLLSLLLLLTTPMRLASYTTTTFSSFGLLRTTTRQLGFAPPTNNAHHRTTTTLGRRLTGRMSFGGVGTPSSSSSSSSSLVRGVGGGGTTPAPVTICRSVSGESSHGESSHSDGSSDGRSGGFDSHQQHPFTLSALQPHVCRALNEFISDSFPRINDEDEDLLLPTFHPLNSTCSIPDNVKRFGDFQITAGFQLGRKKERKKKKKKKEEEEGGKGEGKPSSGNQSSGNESSGNQSFSTRLNMSPSEVSNGIIATLLSTSPSLFSPLGPRPPILLPPTFSPPGFIQISYTDSYLGWFVGGGCGCDDVVVEGNDIAPRRPNDDRHRHSSTVLVDYSSPNIAKPLHVGHLRSTIIGDVLASLLEHNGWGRVLRRNHVGDFGTQFGMLTEYLKEVEESEEEEGEEGETRATTKKTKNATVDDLVRFYQESKKRFDADEGFRNRSRMNVVSLQSPSAESDDVRRRWEDLKVISRRSYDRVYAALGVETTTDEEEGDRNGMLVERGESSYGGLCEMVCERLREEGVAEVSEGALAVFPEGWKGEEEEGGEEGEGEEEGSGSGSDSGSGSKSNSNSHSQVTPLLIKKGDSAFLYATTDLSAVYERTSLTGVSKVLYVTDSGQASHFASVFSAARRGGLAPETAELVHVPFGLVKSGETGKKFATREGTTVKLMDLLDEAVKRATEDLRRRVRGGTEGEGEGHHVDDDGYYTDDRIASIGRSVGIGAVKYADLSVNRVRDYEFSYDRMLSLQGNTAPYMMYAYARLCGILRKIDADGDGDKDADKDADADADAQAVSLTTPAELSLARSILMCSTMLESAEDSLSPHILTGYLYDLSKAFNQFYENCPVRDERRPEVKRARILLIKKTRKVIETIMGILGIDLLERM